MSLVNKRRYAIAKLEVEFRVLAEELIILETNTRRMDLPQLLTVWQPEIISSKLYIQLTNIGEEQNARKKRKKKKEQSNIAPEHDGKIQHGGMQDPSQSLDSGEGEGTYISDVRRRIRSILEDKEEIGGEDREGEPETED